MTRLLDRWCKNSPAIIEMEAADFDDTTTHNHRVFIHQAYKLGICRRNPCRPKNKHRKAARKGVMHKYATHEEVCILMTNSDPYKKFAAAWGLCRGELAALRGDNVLPRVLTVDSHLTRNGIQSGLKYGVDNAIPITPEFHCILSEVPHGKSKHISESRNGIHFSESGFNQAVVWPIFYDAKVSKGFHALHN
ncbi:hypothetical protein [Serratia fonticola]|uniref:hypothetical protein n=1 Tax=Serratia fonticola TaxID=47917 RepID=UPI00301B837A